MADEPAADPASTSPRLPAPAATSVAEAPAGEPARVPGVFEPGLGFSGAAHAAEDGTGRGRDRWFAHAAQGALVVAVVGFGWAIGGHFYAGHKPDGAAIEAAQRAKADADALDQRKATAALAADIKALRGSVEALKLAGTRGPTQDEMHALERTIEGLKGRLETAKTETTAALVQLGGKVDRVQTEPAGKLRDLTDRLDRIEKQTAPPLTTASIPTPAVTVAPKQVALPQGRPAPAEADDKRPQLITGWVVRDVYDGIALVESRHGALEVSRGETIPGAGIVKSIERRGAGWIVVTSRGLVDYAGR